MDKEIKQQKSKAICPRPHSWLGAEFEFKPPNSGSDYIAF